MLWKLMQPNCDPDYDAEPGGGTATAGQGYEDSPAGGGGEETDRDALEQSTKQRLAEAFGDDAGAEDDSDEQDSDESDESDDSESDTGEEPEESDEGDEPEGSDEGDDSDDEEAAAEDEQESDAPTLPDAYRRSLKAYGWEDEEINTNLQQLGDSFIKTAGRIHQNRNKELQDWAAAGRKAREQEDDGGSTDPDSRGEKAAEQQKGDGSQSSLEKLDPEKLREKYGEDEEIEQVVQTVNKTVDTLNQILPQVQQAQQTAQQSEIEAVEREVEGFFGREDVAAYNDLYGDANEGLTDEQIEVRNKVLDNAYNLKLGARQIHGQELSLHDALERAHEMVSGEHKATAARKQVKKQAKKRNKGISQKPSGKKGSGTKTPDGRPQSREDLEERTKSRLQNAFGG